MDQKSDPGMEMDRLTAFLASCELRNMSPKTIEVYGQILRSIQARGKSLESLQQEDLEELVSEWRERGLATGTIEFRFCALSAFFGHLVYKGVLEVNPVTAVRRYCIIKYKEEQTEQKLLSPEEVKRLISCAVDIRNKAIITLFAKTGIRANELRTLDVDSIRWEDNSILLKKTRKRSNRVVFFDEECERILRRWLAARSMRKATGPQLFTVSNGDRISRETMDRVVRKVAQVAGIPGVHMHLFRHFLTTVLLEAGMKREYVQWYRGDAIREAIDIYYHINPENVRKEYLACTPSLGI